MEAYCVKCKKKQEIKDLKEVINKKGLKMATGACPVCSTKMCRILGKGVKNG